MGAHIVFLGPPGSGKGTQSVLLGKKLKVAHVNVGEMLREAIRTKSPVGVTAREYLDRGELVPDSLVIRLVGDLLSHPPASNGFILDGFPRTLTQAKAFKNGIDHVVYIKISDKEALWRLSYRNDHDRDDETLAAIRKRIELFHKHTEPVLSYYRRKKMLREINGEQPIKHVYRDILKALGAK